MLRGIERGQIVADRKDRETFLARLGDVVTATGTLLYAWALLPNHAHLLLRSGPEGLPRVMRRLLTGYASRTTAAIGGTATCSRTAISPSYDV